MKSKINDLLIKQINLILDMGSKELLPIEYLLFILNNYDSIIKLISESEYDATDKNVVESLSILVSKLK